MPSGVLFMVIFGIYITLMLISPLVRSMAKYIVYLSKEDNSKTNFAAIAQAF